MVHQSVTHVEKEVLNYKTEDNLPEDSEGIRQIFCPERVFHLPILCYSKSKNCSSQSDKLIEGHHQNAFLEKLQPLFLVFLPRPLLLIHFVLLKKWVLDVVDDEHRQILVD